MIIESLINETNNKIIIFCIKNTGVFAEENLDIFERLKKI